MPEVSSEPPDWALAAQRQEKGETVKGVRFKYGETCLAEDKYGNKVLLCRNVDQRTYDLMTDGRVFLSPQLARELGAKLLMIAAELKP